METPPSKRAKFVTGRKLYAMPFRRVVRRRPFRRYRRRVARPFRRRVYRRAARPELKNIDVFPGPFDLDSTTPANLILLNSINQGVDASERIGRKVTFSKEMVRLSMKLTDSAGTGPPTDGCVCRIMLVQDRQPNGTVFSLTDLLNAATSTSFNNLDNGRRFYVHKDIRRTFDADASNATRTVSINLSRRIQTTYTGTGGGITDIVTNSLYLVFIADSFTSTDLLNIRPSARLRYADN